MKGKMFGILLLSLVVFAAAALAKIDITSVGTECIEAYPGDTIVKTLRLEVEQSGWYDVVVSSPIEVTPSNFSVYLEADEPEYRILTIHTPTNVDDDYYSVVITLYTADGQYVEDTTMCIHVTKYGTVGAGEYVNFAFGAEDYYEEDGYFVVPLYVENTGQTDVTVEFSADYYNVRFTKTVVTVRPGRTVKVLAKIPSDADIPSAITFRAVGGGLAKKVVVQFTSEATEPRLEIFVPDRVEFTQGTTIVPVRVVNYGDTKVTVKAKVKDAPFGVSSYSDYVTIYPKQEKTINLIVTMRNVLSGGERVGRICLLNDAEVDVACKYVVLYIPEPESKEAKVEIQNGEKIVELTVENGARAYDNAVVEVDAPEGWLVKVEPDDILDIPAYETVDVKVYFKPTDDAKDGTATIYLKAPDGTILAKKTVDLSKSELTGYAVLGSVSPAWVIVGIIVLAVLFALFSKGGAGKTGLEELKAEITKK